MEKQAFRLLMDKLQGIDKRLEEGDKKFDSFQETIYQLNITIKESTDYVKESSSEIVVIKNKLENIENEIIPLKDHVKKVNRFTSIFNPTKKKMAWSLTAISLFFGIIKLVDYFKIKNIL